MERCIVTLGTVPDLDDGRYIISRSDLLCGNIIMQNDGGKQDVNFINYEYAVPAPAAFNLANYFSDSERFRVQLQYASHAQATTGCDATVRCKLSPASIANWGQPSSVSEVS